MAYWHSHTSSTNVLSSNHLPIPWCASPSSSLPLIPSLSMATITNKLEALRWEAVSVPSYACLFVGHIEEQIFQQYRGKTPDRYKRYIDDIVGAASGTKEDLEDFATFVNNFHPSLKFIWAISDDKLLFLDLYLTPSSNRLITTIHYKETDSHSYLNSLILAPSSLQELNSL